MNQQQQPGLFQNHRYTVSLDIFEGPLDLLLHLIRKHELDIFDIPMAFITSHYLEYIETMKVLNLNIASEYLEMAAQLVLIKSRMMLPAPPATDEDFLTDDGPDPREDLVRRLLEYQKYRTAAEELANRPQPGRDVFLRPDDDSEAPPRDLDSPGLFALMEALKQVFEKLDLKDTDDYSEITISRVSITVRIHQILELLEQSPRLSFMSLFKNHHTRADVVSSFLAILEMAKLSLVRIHQAAQDGEIHLSANASRTEAETALMDTQLEDE